jgi:hypothetical protein
MKDNAMPKSTDVELSNQLFIEFGNFTVKRNLNVFQAMLELTFPESEDLSQAELDMLFNLASRLRGAAYQLQMATKAIMHFQKTGRRPVRSEGDFFSMWLEYERGQPDEFHSDTVELQPDETQVLEESVAGESKS